MAQLEDYNTPTRRQHLAIQGHAWRWSWIRVRWECTCGRRICYLADEARRPAPGIAR